MVVAESELIKCPECGKEFAEEDTEYCHKCDQTICPHCGACGCNSLIEHRVTRFN